jgi:hypothetical protein
MATSNQVVHLIVLDPLWVAAGFLLFTLSAWLVARRSRSRLATVSAAAFAYCALAQFARFALQFVPDSSAVPFGNALFIFSRLWPAVFLVAAVASLAGSLRASRVAAP